jgi:O-methyltransferase involved in polyketide biosynthesis
MKQNLKGVSETLLIPLWARAVETRHSPPIIKDENAVEMMGDIEYDFSKFDGRKMPQVSIAIRTELLDKSTKTFMDRHPDANVINLGCGLDTRFSRLDNGKTHWYDLDLPESIHLRRQFFNETDRYKMIAEILMYFTEQEVNELMDKMVTNFPDAEMLIETILPSLVKQAKNRI